uniref:TIDP3438 n=1 Tax=Arundo donax TaxID=35708 RepID=A0A0A8Y932_ARUDO
MLIMDCATLAKKASRLPANWSTIGAVVPCAWGDDLSS